MRIPARSVPACFGFVFLVACGSDGGPTRTIEDPVVSVAVSPDSVTLLEGDSARMTAEIRRRSGTDTGASISWTSLSPSVASVSATGTVRGRLPGEALIVASVSGVADTARVRVLARAEEMVPVSGSGQVGPPGATLPDPLVVRVVDARGGGVADYVVEFETATGGGQVIPTRVMTDDAGIARSTWTLGPEAGEQLAQAVALEDTIRFTALAQSAAARVEVVPQADTLVVGEEVQLTATAYTSAGSVVAAAIQWSSSAESVASVDSTGLVQGRSAGSAWIVAVTASGARDSAAIVVQPAAAACTAASALALQLGEVVQYVGAESAALCLGAGEYVAVPFHATPVTSARLTVDVDASGVTSAVGPPSPTRTAATRLQSDPRYPDPEWEHRFRERERDEIEPRIRSLRDRSEDGALFSKSADVPAVGDLLQLSTAASCTSPRYATGRVVAVSERAVIVADTANPSGGFSAADYQSIGAAVDTLIYPVNVENFGDPTDLDENGRIIVFYTRAVNQLTPPGSQGFVGGFFWSGDLIPPASCPGTNYAEMFYLLAPDPEGKEGNVFSRDFVFRSTLGTVGHELQHLINAARRIYVNGASFLEVVWLNEALSHVAEELLFYRVTPYEPGQNLSAADLQASQATVDAVNRYMISNLARYRSYLQNPDTVSLIGVDDLPTRGASWAFLRYAADRYSGPDQEFLFRLVNATSTGLTNLAEVTGADPLAWMQDWTVSVYADDAVPSTAALYQQPSWNFRDVIPLLGGGFPLRVTSLSDGRVSFDIRAGGSRFLRFGVPSGSAASLEWSTGGIALPPELRLSLQRTR